jgi:hypothetical protein
MVSQTRKRGGALLGEGAHGKAYNVGVTPRNTDALYKLLEHNAYKVVTLETLTDPVTLDTPKDIDAFTAFLKQTKNLIGKVVKAPQFWQKKTQEVEFRDELEVNRQVLKAFGPAKSDTFLTIQPIRGFRDLPILGFTAIKQGAPKSKKTQKITKAKKAKETLYVIFGHKCDPKYKVKLDDFLLDIIESLVELESHGLKHNDIKPTNIVRCGRRYKLIDWGATTSADKKNRGGGVPMSSPMRYYIGGLTPYMSRFYPYIGVEYEYNDWFNTNTYQDLYHRIEQEFKDALETTKDRDALFKTYGPSSDLYQLGITVALLLHEHKIMDPKYTPIVNKLTSLKHPPKSAKEMYGWLRSVLR